MGNMGQILADAEMASISKQNALGGRTTIGCVHFTPISLPFRRLEAISNGSGPYCPPSGRPQEIPKQAANPNGLFTLFLHTKTEAARNVAAVAMLGGAVLTLAGKGLRWIRV
jgi:hypothetical protein